MLRYKMSLSAQQINFGIELKQAAICELNFLKKISRKKWLQDLQILQIAVHRYEKLWLPLLASTSNNFDTDLEYLPPLEVHWAWHAHMLSPINYQKDCSKIFARSFNHKFEFLDANQKKKRDKTEKVWSRLYPNDPYRLPENQQAIILYTLKTLYQKGPNISNGSTPVVCQLLPDVFNIKLELELPYFDPKNDSQDTVVLGLIDAYFTQLYVRHSISMKQVSV